MTRLILIRHGESEYNLIRRYTGQSDIDLTDKGRLQASITGEYILANYKIDEIWSSDLRRAIDTARPIAEPLGLPIKTDKRLFMQAIENLISNCAEHSENNTEVDILISKRSVEFTNISDHKIENTDELKKPFVKGSESRGVSGTGLGLAIAENDLMRLGYELHLKYVEPKFIATVLLK